MRTQEKHIMAWSKGHKGRPEAWEKLSSSLAKVVPSEEVVPEGH